ncbi:MAG: phosphatase PAP2 family protein [Chitinophagaceae bacterium]|nr:phosphatase PAP2 family protein [Chitinophagaceae bacterium]
MFLLSGFMNWALKTDRWLLHKINAEWTSPPADLILPWLRHSHTWAPLYLFLFAFTLMNFGKRGLLWILFFIATFALTDATGTYIFKYNFQRLRPCADPEFAEQVRLLLSKCSGGYSFISNHAANHFGMGLFFMVTFRPLIGRWAYVSIFWAALIAYCQIYVGVHFPSDIVAGAVVGTVFGTVSGYLFNKRFGFFNFEPSSIPRS